MKKGLLITLGVIVAVLVLIVLPIISSYNGLVSMQTNVEGKQAPSRRSCSAGRI